MIRNPEHVLRTRLHVPRDVGEVFAFFGAAENLQLITPPELGFRIATPSPIVMETGARIDYRLSLFGLPFTWRTEITVWDPPYQFVDVQLAGPYAQWIHTHTFYQNGNGTTVEDEVRYRLPVPLLGVFAYPVVRLQLSRIFSYRAKRIRELIA